MQGNGQKNDASDEAHNCSPPRDGLQKRMKSIGRLICSPFIEFKVMPEIPGWPLKVWAVEIMMSVSHKQ